MKTEPPKQEGDKTQSSNAEQKRADESSKPAANVSQGKPSFEEIAMLAFLLWEKRGSEGDDLNDWLEAEKQLKAKYQELPASVLNNP